MIKFNENNLSWTYLGDGHDDNVENEKVEQVDPNFNVLRERVDQSQGAKNPWDPMARDLKIFQGGSVVGQAILPIKQVEATLGELLISTQNLTQPIGNFPLTFGRHRQGGRKPKKQIKFI